MKTILGVIVGIFIILIPAFAQVKYPVLAWIFFPSFGVFFIAIIIFSNRR